MHSTLIYDTAKNVYFPIPQDGFKQFLDDNSGLLVMHAKHSGLGLIYESKPIKEVCRKLYLVTNKTSHELCFSCANAIKCSTTTAEQSGERYTPDGSIAIKEWDSYNNEFYSTLNIPFLTLFPNLKEKLLLKTKLELTHIAEIREIKFNYTLIMSNLYLLLACNSESYNSFRTMRYWVTGNASMEVSGELLRAKLEKFRSKLAEIGPAKFRLSKNNFGI